MIPRTPTSVPSAPPSARRCANPAQGAQHTSIRGVGQGIDRAFLSAQRDAAAQRARELRTSIPVFPDVADLLAKDTSLKYNNRKDLTEQVGSLLRALKVPAGSRAWDACIFHTNSREIQGNPALNDMMIQMTREHPNDPPFDDWDLYAAKTAHCRTPEAIISPTVFYDLQTRLAWCLIEWLLNTTGWPYVLETLPHDRRGLRITGRWPPAPASALLHRLQQCGDTLLHDSTRRAEIRQQVQTKKWTQGQPIFGFYTELKELLSDAVTIGAPSLPTPTSSAWSRTKRCGRSPPMAAPATHPSRTTTSTTRSTRKDKKLLPT